MNSEMEKRNLRDQDIFYFYNSYFDPISLINKNLLKDIQPNNHFYTNAFGVLIAPEIFPAVLSGKEGKIEDTPIPSNWHADIAEFGAVFRSIQLDKRQEFVMCELGCAWGCWMNISGKVAKKNGHSVHLIGVEGDNEFIKFAKKELLSNQFTPDEFSIFHGIIAPKDGTALFPKHNPDQIAYGFEPIFDISPIEKKKYLKTGKYVELRQFSLNKVLENFDQLDLLHVDIQGGEEKLIPSSISLVNEKVSYMVIGTHSRQIEGKMIDCLINSGWLLEIERPAILQLSNTPIVTVDGVQGWRNPRLLPINTEINTRGQIIIMDKEHGLVLSTNGEHFIKVKIINNSDENWESLGTNPILVAYHWLNNAGNMVTFEGVRTNIEGFYLNAKQTKEQLAKIIAPSKKGEYELVVTMVQEGKQWFAGPSFSVDAMAVKVL